MYMKEIILSLLTIPGLLILLYFFGLVSYGYKKKLKIFSSCLFIMFVISLPFFGKIFSYPLLGLPKFFISSDLNDVKSAVVLTGGIYKNIINKWQPSKNTEERILYAKKLLNKKDIPIIISGGITKKNAPSEAEVTKDFYNLVDTEVETESLNTYQSAQNLKDYCKIFNNNLVIITDIFHSLRSYLSFKSQGCNTILYNYNSYYIVLKDFIPSLYGFSLFNNAVYEYVAIIYYLVTFKINLVSLF
ncbi:MAG: hypothetical protein CM15mP56_4480 [Alphaproteobacteria bacterium]|nr:MAG: hypothetical protein CM15mP56_4480 [Alphaproteobacteria bacterium]